MRYGRKAPDWNARREQPLGLRRISYERLVGLLAFEMAECVRSQDALKLCAPFELVVVDPHGAAAFQCEIGGDWQVRHNARVAWFGAIILRRQHCLRIGTFDPDFSD